MKPPPRRMAASSVSCGAKPGAHLLLGARGAGLVVEDGVAAVRALLDAVGDGRQRELAFADREFQLAADFGMQRRNAGAPLAVPAANQRAMRTKRGHQNARASG